PQFEAIDRIVKVVAEIFPDLLAHLASQARDALRIVLVDVAERRGVGELLQARLFRMKHGELRDKLAKMRAVAARAGQVGRIAVASRENALVAAAIEAAIFVDRHGGPYFT